MPLLPAVPENEYRVIDLVLARAYELRQELLRTITLQEGSEPRFLPIFSKFSKRNSNPKYRSVCRGFNPSDRGKNKTTIMVYSLSKNDHRTKKWMQKDICRVYSLAEATREVFYGQIAFRVFGKNKSPKTKFNPDKQGIVSRILGDNSMNTENMAKFLDKMCNLDPKKIKITRDAQLELAQALAFGVTINDRDTKALNVVVKYETKLDQDGRTKFHTIKQVHGIDHEFGGFSRSDSPTIYSFLNKIKANARILTDIILSDEGKWSSSSVPLVSSPLGDLMNTALSDKVSQQEIEQIFVDIAIKIAKDRFALCEEIKQGMLDQLNAAIGVYSRTEIESIIKPQIESASARLKGNVAVVLDLMSSESYCKWPCKIQ